MHIVILLPLASVISSKGKNVKTMTVEASLEGLKKIHQYLSSTEYCVILESSTYALLTLLLL